MGEKGMRGWERNERMGRDGKKVRGRKSMRKMRGKEMVRKE